MGTALLLAAIVGSGIMGERLAGGNTAIALLANAIATGAALFTLITAFGSMSGAHFNPLVTLIEALTGRMTWRTTGFYMFAQLIGALAGVAVAHLMFGLPLYSLSTHIRTGPAQWFSEGVATFGLMIIILNCARHRPDALPAAVALYITAAYWFTASTSFANPAVTIARSLTDTFSGIRPSDISGFVIAQGMGAAIAALIYCNTSPQHDASATDK